MIVRTVLCCTEYNRCALSYAHSYEQLSQVNYGLMVYFLSLGLTF